MGYRIDYRPVRKLRNMEHRRSLRAMLTGILFLVFLAAVCVCWPDGKAAIREVMFLGKGSVVASAMETLETQMKSGFGMCKSLIQFCISVCEGGSVGEY